MKIYVIGIEFLLNDVSVLSNFVTSIKYKGSLKNYCLIVTMQWYITADILMKINNRKRVSTYDVSVLINLVTSTKYKGSLKI